MNDNKVGEVSEAGETRGIMLNELLDQLDAQLKYYDELPQQEKFMFCTNADLAYFMTLIAAIMKRGFSPPA